MVLSAERKKQRDLAVQMRLGGATYQQISDALNYRGANNAHRDVQAGMDELGADSPEDSVKAEVARLNVLRLSIWKEARQGNLRAIDRVMKIDERLAVLNGPAPSVVEVKVTGYDEIAARRAARLANPNQGTGATG